MPTALALARDIAASDPAVVQAYKRLIDDGYALALTEALAEERRRRGAIDFETLETRMVFDAHGKIEKIVPEARNDAHRLIEECMLAANVSAGNLLSSSISSPPVTARNRGRAAGSTPSATTNSSHSARRCAVAVRTTHSTNVRGPAAVRTRAREMPSSACTACSRRSAERMYSG